MKQTIIHSLILAGRQAPSADNSQPWRFSHVDNRITVEYDTERLAGLTFGANEPATLLSLGCVLENMLQAADFIGVEVGWYLEDELSIGNAVLHLTIPLDCVHNEYETELTFSGHPLFDRHTNRFPYRSTLIPVSIMPDINQFREGTARIKLLDTPKEIKAVAALARQASEVRFQTQEVHEWLAHSLRFTRQEAAKGDGLDIATIPLPPGGALFMRYIMDWKWMSRLNRLGAYKLMAALDVKPIEQAPIIIAFIGGSAREDIINVGQLLTRVWIDLNSKGIAVHPYYVVSDQLQRLLVGKVPAQLVSQIDKVAAQSTALLDLQEHECLHMLLRVGYPTRDPIRSKRLPLEAICNM